MEILIFVGWKQICFKTTQTRKGINTQDEYKKQIQKAIRGKDTQMPNCLVDENADRAHITDYRG